MGKTDGKRGRPGDIFLLAILLGNLLCGVGLITALRAELSKDLVASENTLASSKISAYLWGKVLRFTFTAGEGSTVGENAISKIDADPVKVAADLPAKENFQRIRSGTGESLPVFIGVPRDRHGGGRVLPFAVLVPGATREDRHYLIGVSSLADIDQYLEDLDRRGIHCRIVDPEGNILFGATGESKVPGNSAYRFEGGSPLMVGALSREWTLQTYIPKLGSRLPFLPQAILATFFLLNMFTLIFLRNRFILPAEAALEAVTETVAVHGEILPPRAAPAHIAGAITSLLSRCRLEKEEESRALQETAERRLREISDSQKSLIWHHRLTKKMLRSRDVDEVFEILLAGVTEGHAFPGALIGKTASDGYLVFQGETDPVSGNPLRIPLWNPGSLLARAFWSGNLFHESPQVLPHLPEEESILGSLPVLCLPVMRNLHVPCAETRNCVNRTCPNFQSVNMKCWLRKIPQEFFSGAGDPESHREAIIACLRCEVFPSSALLLIRSVPDGKVVTRENAVPLSNLASEAGHALEVVSLYDNMKIMAVTDGLTNLFNHREFYQALRRELERARRYRHTVSLLMIDVDDFKQFNDMFGHPAGDDALRNIAALMRKCARTTDILARYGGEEFAVILPESTPGGALMVAERIKMEVAQHNFILTLKDQVHMTVSIGVYSSENGDVTEDQIVSLADDACYLAKKGGKNQVVVKASA